MHRQTHLNQLINLNYDQSIKQFSSLFCNPEFYVAGLIYEGERAVLLSMSRDTYTSSTFLDTRTITASAMNYTIPIEALNHLYKADNKSIRPLNYIFHTAMCGSTLMCRALDKPGICLPYKEPYLLHQYSLAKRGFLKFKKNITHPNLLELSTKVVTRSFTAEETSIIKLTDTCANLTEELLEFHPDSRGILLYEKLDEFLLSALKAPYRREYIRGMLHRAKTDMDSLGVFNTVNTESLNDAQAAAYVWLGMMYLYRDAINKYGSRLKTLHSNIFFTQRQRSLIALTKFFKLNFSQVDIQEICNSDTFKRDSKAQNQEFDNTKYQVELKKTAESLNSEITEGVNWVKKIQVKDIITDALSNKLL